jgi:thiol-disulfide isomerase/thioredoxin
MLLLALLCSTGTGCSLFKKNTNGTQGPGGGPTPAKFPGGQDPLVPTPPPQFPNTKAAATAPGSTLAGAVVDAYQRPISNAYIRWVSLDPSDNAAPIDVPSDVNGYFTIMGVKPGGQYKLIARAKQGEKMLAGTVLTSAPDVHVVIPIREDLVNSSTPPMPGNPAQGQQQNKDPQGTSKNELPAMGYPKKSDPPNLPATMTVPAPPITAPTSADPGFVPGVVGTPPKDRLPMLHVPGKKPEAPRLPSVPGDAKLDTGPTRVPSCILLGRRLENLALKDSNGQTWEYKKQGAGKVVLIDFWGTYCLPCRSTMPALSRLQTQYGQQGLEVIGIALEAGKDERKEADVVNKTAASMQLTYRQLMGRGHGFDAGAAANFNVKMMPTVLLLNQEGQIIFEHVGRLDAAQLAALERAIQGCLTRPF